MITTNVPGSLDYFLWEDLSENNRDYIKNFDFTNPTSKDRVRYLQECERRRKWDIRFLRLAREISGWSKDPSTKVGCVIADINNRPKSFGFNGLPQKVIDDYSLLKDRERKIAKIIHAEVNGVLFANGDLDDCTVYVYPFLPCAPCASILTQKNIFRVVSTQTPPEIWSRWETSLREGVNTFKFAHVYFDNTYSVEDLNAAGSGIDIGP